MKVIWVSLKVGLVYYNPEQDSCLNTCVLFRSCYVVLKNLKIPDPYTKFSFAKGLAKVKLGELINGS